jgi:hypothetical protein
MEYIVGWDGGISSIGYVDNGCEKSWTQQKSYHAYKKP